MTSTGVLFGSLSGFVEMVGVEGFELSTSCSQSKRATGLRYTPTGAHRMRSSGIQSNEAGIYFRVPMMPSPAIAESPYSAHHEWLFSNTCFVLMTNEWMDRQLCLAGKRLSLFDRPCSWRASLSRSAESSRSRMMNRVRRRKRDDRQSSVF